VCAQSKPQYLATMKKRLGSSDKVKTGENAVKKGDNFMRNKNTIKRLQMYKSGGLIRDKDGQITGGDLRSRDKAGGAAITGATGRVAPDRRWFGNTRVIGQKELDSFRDAMDARTKDPYSVVLHSKTLPMGLLTDGNTRSRVDLLSAESYGGTFGPKAQRKRVKLAVTDVAEFANSASHAASGYSAEADTGRVVEGGEARDEARASLFDKGTSRRIWGELYKVLDCSDVVVQVLDARDPLGTRSPHVEKYLREHAKHKHLVFVLNKCDLVPTWVTRRWVAALSCEYPTLAFHASITHPFGKGALIALLRQFARLHSDKKSISVGFIGYPNVGKSSIINALRSKKVCKVAPIPGETKVWQYVTLMKRVFLIDCPGIVYPNPSDSEADIVLKGVVRAEKLEAPQDCIPDILRRIKPEHMAVTYGVAKWTDSVDFLTQLATRNGRLLRGGEPDLVLTSRAIIFDWQRGKLPYYSLPPAIPGREGKGSAAGAAGAGGLGVTQAIPRLGAHALLEAEEEEEDRKMAPVTSDSREAEDEAEEEEDGDEDALPEWATAAAAPVSSSVSASGVGSKRSRRSMGEAAEANSSSSAAAAPEAAAESAAAAPEAGKSGKSRNRQASGAASAGAGGVSQAKRRRVEAAEEEGAAVTAAGAGSVSSKTAAAAATSSSRSADGSGSSNPGVVLSLADFFGRSKAKKDKGERKTTAPAPAAAAPAVHAMPPPPAPAPGTGPRAGKQTAKLARADDAAAATASRKAGRGKGRVAGKGAGAAPAADDFADLDM